MPFPSKPATATVVGAFLIVYLVWGSTYLAIHVAIQSASPFALGAYRFVSAGALLYAWTRWRGAARPTRADWGEAAIVGFLMLTAGNGVMSYVMLRMPTGVASLIVATVPIWMLTIQAMADKVRPDGRVITGIVAGTIAAGLLATSDAGWVGGADPVFVGMLVFASLCWALGSVYAGRRTPPTDLRLRVAMQMLVGGALMGLVATAQGEMDAPWQWPADAVWGLVYLSLAGSIVAYQAYIWLMRHVPPAAASTYAFVNPLVAIALGVVWLNEPLTGRTLTAAALVLAAVVLITQRKQPTRVKEPIDGVAEGTHP